MTTETTGCSLEPMNETIFPTHNPDNGRPLGSERTVCRGQELQGRTCLECSKALLGRRPQARFCSARCRTRHRRLGIHETVRTALVQAESTIHALVAAIALLDET